MNVAHYQSNRGFGTTSLRIELIPLEPDDAEVPEFCRKIRLSALYG